MANRKITALRNMLVALGYGSAVTNYTSDTVVGTLKEFAVKASITGSVDNIRANSVAEVCDWIANNYGTETHEPYNLTESKTHATVTYKRNGKTVTAGNDLLYKGDKLTVTATADEGYTLTTLTANGEDIESGEILTIGDEAIAIVATATATE